MLKNTMKSEGAVARYLELDCSYTLKVGGWRFLPLSKDRGILAIYVMKKKILIICLIVFLILVVIISAIIIIKNQVKINEEKNLQCRQAVQRNLEQDLNLSSDEYLADISM